jgi:hypothetical protein
MTFNGSTSPPRRCSRSPFAGFTGRPCGFSSPHAREAPRPSNARSPRLGRRFSRWGRSASARCAGCSRTDWAWRCRATCCGRYTTSPWAIRSSRWRSGGHWPSAECPRSGRTFPCPTRWRNCSGSACRPVRRLLLALALGGDLDWHQLASLAGPGAVKDALAAGVVADGERARAAHPLLAAAARKHSDSAECRACHLELAGVVAEGDRRKSDGSTQRICDGRLRR